MLDIFDDILESENESWKIEDDSAAEWALRKVLGHFEERDRLLSLVHAEQARLAEKEEEINKKCDSNTGFLLLKLEEYFSSVKTRDTATQSSYKLLSGTLVYKKPKVDIQPGEALVEWLEENRPEFVTVEKKANWKEIKKHVTQIAEGVYALDDTGEILDGILPKEIPGKFEVKT
jgi:hypothetical protein